MKSKQSSQGSTLIYTATKGENESNEQVDISEFDPTGQTCPPGGKPRVTTTFWEDEGTLCFQVEAKSVCVARREDNDMVNGTKLLNVAGMSRGKRDGILKGEKVRSVVKVGAMHLKGVWISFERALEFANKERITDLLYPLFVTNIKAFLYHPTNYVRTTAVMAAAQHLQMLRLSRNRNHSVARRLKERQMTPPHTAPILMNRRWSQEGALPNNTSTYMNASTVTQSLPVTPVTTPPGYFLRSTVQSSEERPQNYVFSYSEPRNKICHRKQFQQTYGIPVSRSLWGISRERRASASSLSLDHEELKQTYEEDYIKQHPPLYREIFSQQNQPFHELMVQNPSLLSPVAHEYIQKEGINANSGVSMTLPGPAYQASDDASTINSQSSYSYQSVDDTYLYLPNTTNMPSTLNDLDPGQTTSTHFPITTAINQWEQRDVLSPKRYSIGHNKQHSIFTKTWSPQTWKEASRCNDFYHQIVDTNLNNRLSRSTSIDQAYLSLRNVSDDHQNDYSNIHLNTESITNKDETNGFNNAKYIEQDMSVSSNFNSTLLSDVSDMKVNMFSNMKPHKRRKTIHEYMPILIQDNLTNVNLNQNVQDVEANRCHLILDI
ncbi:hypothetical protein T552_01976 [Pneumocystis carinii B80]|uniref:HTH APSES-type domain-containing protein n=1 Tax=Pneumocystis carinii (strain B80) TaxID=1408658 RepID=A0A0W4ZIB4_PNEC8|nr:hypothetical protein T552_01976 [Pneumocystis carinii B80]KTW28115.1 hypothetical protein T552_01976 [Pneumocystis carinii B80]